MKIITTFHHWSSRMMAFGKRALAILLIYSLVSSSCVWATGHGPIIYIDEQLENSSVASSNGGGFVLVAPGTVRPDRTVHNIFNRLQAAETSTTLFLAPPETESIYTRVYHDAPLSFSGAIEARAHRFVLGNTGGIHLRGTEFHGMTSLVVAAAHIQNSNKGMASTVEEGGLTLNQILCPEKEGPQILSLIGRRAHVSKSLLAPADQISISVGKQNCGLETPWLEVPAATEGSPSVVPDSLVIDADSTLRSKSIFLQSLDHGADLRLNGFLQSLEGDITIRAQGDVYLSHLFTNRNLTIKTTGNVFFGDDVFVGGATNVEGRNIDINSPWESEGEAIFKASAVLSIKGAFKSKGAVELIGQESVHIDETITAHGPLDIISQGPINQQEPITSDASIRMFGGQINKNSSLESDGPIDLLAQEDVVLDAGNIETPSWVRVFSKTGKIHNLTEIIPQEFLTLKGPEVVNDGILTALGGVICDVTTLTNNNTISFLGAGLSGQIGTFTNRGNVDLSRVDADIKSLHNTRYGNIRTAGHFTHRGDSHVNDGTIFTLGVHSADLSGEYKDNGKSYFPTLLAINADSVVFTNKSKLTLTDIVAHTRGDITIEPTAQFDFPQIGYFLDFFGENVTFDGRFKHNSRGRFPYLDFDQFFGIAIEQHAYVRREDELRRLIESLRPRQWIEEKARWLTQFNIRARRNTLVRSKDITAENRSACVSAGVTAEFHESSTRFGPFHGNKFIVSGTKVVATDSEIGSLGGTTVVQSSGDTLIQHSTIEGGAGINMYAKTMDVQDSTAVSTDGSVQVIGQDSLTAAASRFKGKQDVSMQSDGGVGLTNVTVEGPHNSMRGDSVTITDSDLSGQTQVQAEAQASVHNATLNGEMGILAPRTELSGHIHGKSGGLEVIGDHVEASAGIDLPDLAIKARTLDQSGTTNTKHTQLYVAEYYTDTADTRNHASKIFTLIAPNNTGFCGTQKAGDKATIKVRSMDLFALLQQIDAPTIVADIGSTDVTFGTYHLVPNLTLFAASLTVEKGATLTTEGDLIATLQQRMDNDGTMRIAGEGSFGARAGIRTREISTGGDLHLATDGPAYVKGMQRAGGSASLLARGVSIEREVIRRSIPGGYKEELGPEVGLIAGGGKLSIKAREWLRARAATLETKGDAVFSAPDHYQGSQVTSSDVKHKSKRKYYHRHEVTHHKTQVRAEGNIIFLAKAPDAAEGDCMPRLVFEGISATAGRANQAYSEGTLESRTVHDTFEEERKSKKKRGLRGTKRRAQKRQTDEVGRNEFRAGEEVTQIAEGTNLQVAPDIEAGIFVHLKSMQGKLLLKGDKSSTFFSKTKSSRSIVWQSMAQKGRFDETGEVARITAPSEIELFGAEGIEVDVVGRTLDEAFARHAEDPANSWVGLLRDQSNVSWNLITEEHKKWSSKSAGLSPVAAIVISIIVGAASGGTGTAIGLSGAWASMFSAGVSALASRSAIAIINNEGRINRVLKDLSSKGQIRSFVTCVIAAGLIHGITDALELPTEATKFSDHLKTNLIRESVHGSLSAIVEGKDIEDVLEDGLRGVVAATLGAYLAQQVGMEYKDPEGCIDPITHKILHAALGAGMGAISHKEDILQGALAGCVGAAVGEVVGEIYADYVGFEAFDPSDPDRRAAVVCNGEALSQIAGALAAGLMGLDPDQASRAAQNAVRNNAFFVPLLIWGAAAALTAYEAYEIYEIYQTEGHEAAAQQLIITGVITVATAGAGKVVYRIGKMAYPTAAAAFKAYYKQSPIFAKIERWVGGKASRVPGYEKVPSSFLPKPDMIQHHIFNKFRGKSPASQKYRDFFMKHGIDVDKFTVDIPATFHISKIHTAGNNWTTRWKRWIDSNPDASTKSVYQFAGQLMDDYGINHLPMRRY